MDKASSQEFQKQLGRMEELIGALEKAPDAILREQVRELIQTLLELHGTGLERILSRVYDSPVGGSAVIDELSQDRCLWPAVIAWAASARSETRVRNALEEVKPRLGCMAAASNPRSELGRARPLKAQGNCHECPLASDLAVSIEEALNTAAPV
jgi:hypothetical protein